MHKALGGAPGSLSESVLKKKNLICRHIPELLPLQLAALVPSVSFIGGTNYASQIAFRKQSLAT